MRDLAFYLTFHFVVPTLSIQYCSVKSVCRCKTATGFHFLTRKIVVLGDKKTRKHNVFCTLGILCALRYRMRNLPNINLLPVFNKYYGV